MPEVQATGEYGEQQAALFLAARGMLILARNLRAGRREVDLLAMDGSVLVFVEVKTRSSMRFGPPESHVDERKRGLLISAAEEIMREIGFHGECRFDIVSVYLPVQATGAVIRHFRDAFF